MFINDMHYINRFSKSTLPTFVHLFQNWVQLLYKAKLVVFGDLRFISEI